MTLRRVTTTPVAHSLRVWRIVILTLGLLLVVGNAIADDLTKPPERKRLGGIKSLTKAQIEDFLSERRNAAIATIHKDGAPQLTPVIYYWDGVSFYVSITQDTVKYANIKRDPRVSIIVDDVLNHHCVIAKGKAVIQEENVWDMTGKIIYKYYGHKEGTPYLEQIKKQKRVLIVLKPTKMQAWGPIPR